MSRNHEATAASDQKLVIVSNRLPVSVSKTDEGLTYTPSSGGLATAMSSLDVDSEQLWIGWPGIASDDIDEEDQRQITLELKKYGCIPVFLTKEQVHNFYEGYANDTLWPLFHYFQSTAHFTDDYWQGYEEVNHLFSQVVTDHSDPHSVIWIHDYHFMLLPGLVREALPEASIGFFLHIPFPSYEIFRLLPERRQILEGLLGADLLGFHTYDYARHFSSSVLRLVGHESRHGVITIAANHGKATRKVQVDAFPISIDYKKFSEALSSEPVAKELEKLDKHYDGQKIIMSVDRLDYSKGIAHRLEAYEQFLREYPESHKKVTLAMVAVPSRTEVDTYRELRDEIEVTVSRINGMYGTIDWTPISYQFKNLPFDQIVALYAKSDVALVTPLRDGMNLVAKEYVACKQQRTGVLILSEMTGAMEEMPESMRINPNDTSSIVEAIRQALVMPEQEQRNRMRSMQRRLSRYSVQRWANDFIEQLGAARERQHEQNAKVLGERSRSELVEEFTNADKRLILLDYDGTLAGFVDSPDPDKVKPSRSLLADLDKLTRRADTEVCIISGRTRDALESWFGELDLTLVAEHGSWIKQDGNWAQQQISFKQYRDVLLPIMERYAERTPGAEVEEKNFALVWHYNKVAPELAYDRTANLKRELSALVNGSEVAVYSGRKIIEVKPRGVHKGTVAEELLVSSAADFVLCAGDDYTDEDMFKSLPEDTYTLKVGNKETHARFIVPDVTSMTKLLHDLATSKASKA